MRLLIGLAFGVVLVAAHGTEMADPHDRPALVARHPLRSALMGAARAGRDFVAVGERGLILSSSDEAKTWHQRPSPVAVTLTAVRFANDQQGAAVGHSGVVLFTGDGGRTWNKRLDGVQAAALALKAAEAAGDPQATARAQRLVDDGPDKPFLDLHLFDARRAVAVGAYNLVFYTDDAGQTWRPWMDRLDNPRGLHLYSVRARGAVVLIAGEQGLVLRSDDGGGHFRRLTTPYAGSFFTCEVLGEREMILAGMRGTVLYSGDAGHTWQPLPLPLYSAVTASLVQDDDVLLVLQSGTVLSRSHQGLRAGAKGMWQVESLPGLPPLSGALGLDGHRLLLLSLQGPWAVNRSAVQ